MKVILASTSPRRRELIKYVTDDFEAYAADVDEQAIEAELEAAGGFGSELELAEKMVKALSSAKALAVYDACGRPENTLIIGADTVVALENEILGKPKDREDAVRMLRAQSKEPQRVLTGVTLIYNDEVRTFAEETLVYFKPLDEEQEARIQAYCDTEEPYDKAGAYGIQLNGGFLVDRYEGDYDNVVGFPVERIRNEAENFTGLKLK